MKTINTHDNRPLTGRLPKKSPSWYLEVRRLTEQLVKIPTISPDHSGENACACEIKELLAADTGLAADLWPTDDGRFNVSCLLKGEHPANNGKTIILMGHYDTVGVEEFRAIDPSQSGQIAFEPTALKAALIEKLKQGRSPDEDEVWADLNAQSDHPLMPDGPWLFGRGSVDMKSGIAISMAIIRQMWSERKSLAGNILFLACPDEENESAGVRAAVSQLITYRDIHQIEYSGLINTDYSAPRMYGTDDGRGAYTGTVGKLLPAFYILGVPSHVGAPFRGVDAGQIAAEIVRRINLNVDLCDRWVRADLPNSPTMRMEVGMPPVTLKMCDLKDGYNVQTAAEAFVYVNWLTYTTSPLQALERMMAEAWSALSQTLTTRNERYQQFTNSGDFPTQYEGRVLSFEMLQAAACRAQGWTKRQLDKATQAWLDESAEHNPSWASCDLREKSRLLVAHLTQLANLNGPAVIVFFAPPYYPHVQPQQSLLSEAIQQALAHSNSRQATENPLTLNGFYPYISDMSFVTLDESIEADLPALEKNMPMLGRDYKLDFDEMRQLNCPVANIGPWGKDAHSLFERVYMPYSFETAPQLIYDTLIDLFRQAEESTEQAAGLSDLHST